MRNCLILGAGRSGTSMAAGTLAAAGYFMGHTLLPATDANPKGYYESREVEQLNDRLIATMIGPQYLPPYWERALARLPDSLLPPALRVPPPVHLKQRPPEWLRWRWLALVPVWRRPDVQTADRQAIPALSAHAPYCYKDPRFAYTLAAWLPHVEDAVRLVVFRHPAVTAVSMMKDLRDAEYLADVIYSEAQARWLWSLVYRHILGHYQRDPDKARWLFLHYDQMLTPGGLDAIAAHTGAALDRSFPEARLSRSRADAVPVPAHMQRLYARLNALAGYTPEDAA